jgi:hypothetical protein
MILHEMLTGVRGAWNAVTCRSSQGVGNVVVGLLQFHSTQRFPHAAAVIAAINALGIATR